MPGSENCNGPTGPEGAPVGTIALLKTENIALRKGVESTPTAGKAGYAIGAVDGVVGAGGVSWPCKELGKACNTMYGANVGVRRRGKLVGVPLAGDYGRSKVTTSCCISPSSKAC